MTARLTTLTRHLTPAPAELRPRVVPAPAAGIAAGATILFQGDSITDAGRNKEGPLQENVGLGMGYAKMTAAALLMGRPGDGLKCHNRGVGGNRIVDVYARMAADGTALKPDLVSMLIGVNDTCLDGERPNGVPVPKYEKIYRMFLEEMRTDNPAVQFVLCHPFVLDCGNITVTGYARWRAEIDQRRAVTDKLAAEFGATVVDFQAMFDEAVKQAPPEYWGPDGVHPSHAGHALMAKTWLEAVGGMP
jgi:lysophospholipase L1-like esterase